MYRGSFKGSGCVKLLCRLPYVAPLLERFTRSPHELKVQAFRVQGFRGSGVQGFRGLGV